MIIFANSFPKTGSTYLFQLISILLNYEQNYSHTRKALYQQIELGNIDGSGDFIRDINEDSLSILKDITGDSGVLLLKCHIFKSEFFDKYVDEYSVFSTFSYRDPRDILISSIDHRDKNIAEGKEPDFPDLNLDENALALVGKSIDRIHEFQKVRGVLSVKYEQLIPNPEKTLTNVAKYLKIDVDSKVISSVLQLEKESRAIGKKRFNKGVCNRYKEEMDRKLLDLINNQFGQQLKNISY